MSYHYGATIKKYREKMGLTQAKLAELWPKKSGEAGVSTRYVQDIEYGNKHIDDIQTLRKLCDILSIPYWEVGLSEYNPFNPGAIPGQGRYMYDETLDVIEDLIRQVWSLRCAARLADADRSTKRLNESFSYFREHLPPPLRLENRFQLLYLQVQRLNAVNALEKKDYTTAVAIYNAMKESVAGMNNPAATAIALTELGKELERKGEKQQAVHLLEDARDYALASSRLSLAFTQSYLIRVYAGNHDKLRFERAVNTGLTIARSLNEINEDRSELVYSWSPVSSILAEKSWGYLELGEPDKVLAMREEIADEIQRGNDIRIDAWIPLDWARAYMVLGEVEMCINEARTFYHRCMVMGSTHAISQIDKLLASLEERGYGDVKAVKDFREEI